MTRLWKPPCSPYVPQHVVQIIPVDRRGRVLLMHRSPAVRSAANVWSFPSGLHDIGETIEETARRELLEEYGLTLTDYVVIGVYENIAGDLDRPEEPQYHWVITVVGGLVHDVEAFVNKEPDKHDDATVKRRTCFVKRDFFEDFPFHESFEKWARANCYEICEALRKLITE